MEGSTGCRTRLSGHGFVQLTQCTCRILQVKEANQKNSVQFNVNITDNPMNTLILLLTNAWSLENCERQLMVELVYTSLINTYLCLILLCGPLWVLCWPSMLRLHSSANQSHLPLVYYCSRKCPPQNHSSLVGGTDLAGS